jgi:hypothetical protein
LENKKLLIAQRCLRRFNRERRGEFHETMTLIVDKDRVRAEYPCCYMCDQPKTSAEHVPPLCFFPDEKDSNGNSMYRKNLIKVPSCDLHNLHKSKDDWYAAFHLAGTIRGNQCAALVRKGAIARALKRDQRERGGALTKRLLNQIQGRVALGYYGKIDLARIVQFLDLCARGLYFYEKLKPPKLPLRVANVDYDLQDNPAKKAQLEHFRRSFNEEMKGCEYHGSNPDVFKYRICEKPKKDVTIIEMTFFGELQRWAFYHPDAERQII